MHACLHAYCVEPTHAALVDLPTSHATNKCEPLNNEVGFSAMEQASICGKGSMICSLSNVMNIATCQLHNIKQLPLCTLSEGGGQVQPRQIGPTSKSPHQVVKWDPFMMDKPQNLVRLVGPNSNNDSLDINLLSSTMHGNNKQV